MRFCETTFFYSESVVIQVGKIVTLKKKNVDKIVTHIKLMGDQNLTPLNVHLAICNFLRVKNRRNYNIGPSSLSYVRNWSLKFETCTIDPLSFQNEQYKSFY